MFKLSKMYVPQGTTIFSSYQLVKWFQWDSWQYWITAADAAEKLNTPFHSDPKTSSHPSNSTEFNRTYLKVNYSHSAKQILPIPCAVEIRHFKKKSFKKLQHAIGLYWCSRYHVYTNINSSGLNMTYFKTGHSHSAKANSSNFLRCKS